MTTTQMLASLLVAVSILGLAVLAWLKVNGRLPEVDVYLMRRRIRRAEQQCQRDELWCAVCAHWAGQDVFAEDVRPPEVES